MFKYVTTVYVHCSLIKVSILSVSESLVCLYLLVRNMLIGISLLDVRLELTKQIYLRYDSGKNSYFEHPPLRIRRLSLLLYAAKDVLF